MQSFFDISHKVIVITGISGNLGRIYAQSFLDAGAKVIGLDLVPPDFFDVFKKRYGDFFHFFNVSVIDKIALNKVSDDLHRQNLIPNVLINNAAIDAPPTSYDPTCTGPFEECSEASWDLVLDVNLKGAFLCSQVFGENMARGGGGNIINVSSIYGMVSPDQSIYDYKRADGENFYKPVAYSVSKSGLLNLTKYLAVYWSKKNVRVNTITLAGVLAKQDSRFISEYCKRIPIGRMANAEEYVAPMIFLMSTASSYMTGANLVVDGGWTAI